MLSNPHNLTTVKKNDNKPYGIRISLTERDPFRSLLAENWETMHWFSDAPERDAALGDMRKRHEFSRIGDRPTLRYESIDP